MVELNERNSLFTLILNYMPNGILIRQDDGRIIFYNQPLLDILQLHSNEDVASQVFQSLVASAHSSTRIRQEYGKKCIHRV